MEGQTDDDSAGHAENAGEDEVLEQLDTPAQHGHNVPPVPTVGTPGVAAPRPVPVESGPIPIDDPDPESPNSHPSGGGQSVINLRDPSPDDMKPQSRIGPDSTGRVY
jgi:hypothetical protein